MTNNDPDLMTALTVPELQHRVALHERRIADTLAPYDPVTATFAWLDTLRAVEDCINLPEHNWRDETAPVRLFALPVMALLNQGSVPAEGEMTP